MARGNPFPCGFFYALTGERIPTVGASAFFGMTPLLRHLTISQLSVMNLFCVERG